MRSMSEEIMNIHNQLTIPAKERRQLPKYQYVMDLVWNLLVTWMLLDFQILKTKRKIKLRNWGSGRSVTSLS